MSKIVFLMSKIVFLMSKIVFLMSKTTYELVHQFLTMIMHLLM